MCWPAFSATYDEEGVIYVKNLIIYQQTKDNFPLLSFVSVINSGLPP